MCQRQEEIKSSLDPKSRLSVAIGAMHISSSSSHLVSLLFAVRRTGPLLATIKSNVIIHVYTVLTGYTAS